MNRFRRALKLVLALEDLVNDHKSDSKGADAIREELDPYYGWCAPEYLPEHRLTDDERDMLEEIIDQCRSGGS